MIVRRYEEPIAMTFSRAAFRNVFRAVLVAAAIVPLVRAEDDVIQEEQAPSPPPAQGRVFDGQLQGGQVIIMPGLRLQLGGQGQVQVQGNVPAAADGKRAEGHAAPYLGVVAGPVMPPVRAQLDLPEGVGLSIDAVAVGGPAEKAGVRQFDVIHKFNDQVVCSPEQLTTLVKVAGAGTTVPLTILRSGRERVVEAVLEERVVNPVADADVIIGAMPGVLNLQQMLPPGVAGGLGPQLQADIERRVAEALARAGAGRGMLPGFAPGMVPGVLGNVQTQVLTIGPNAQSATVVSDARGTVEIRSANGKKTVTVKDPDGKEVHSGPLDTDEDMDAVPEDYRDWVREVDGGRPTVEALDEPEAEEPEAKEPEAESATDAQGPTI